MSSFNRRNGRADETTISHSGIVFRVTEITGLGNSGVASRAEGELSALSTSRFIQIQIGSLHTRLDETDEMTNTGVVPAGPFLGARTTRAPRDAGSPPFALSARAEPRIKGGELQ